MVAELHESVPTPGVLQSPRDVPAVHPGRVDRGFVREEGGRGIGHTPGRSTDPRSFPEPRENPHHGARRPPRPTRRTSCRTASETPSSRTPTSLPPFKPKSFPGASERGWPELGQGQGPSWTL